MASGRIIFIVRMIALLDTMRYGALLLDRLKEKAGANPPSRCDDRFEA